MQEYIVSKKCNNDLQRPYRTDLITPGASTVAKFKTVIFEFARFDTSQTERQVNAFSICRASLPTLASLLAGYYAHKKARHVLRLERTGFKYLHTIHQIIQLQTYIFFLKEQKKKQKIHKKLLLFGKTQKGIKTSAFHAWTFWFHAKCTGQSRGHSSSIFSSFSWQEIY